MITNETHKPASDHIEAMRNSFEFRATWMALLIEAAEKKGLDTSFAREAITKCGCFHGVNKYKPDQTLEQFAETFGPQDILDIFEMDIETTDDCMTATFHYCPLVKAWEKLGISEEKIGELCDIAMDGDRGIVSMNPSLNFQLGSTIGKGSDHCIVKVTKA
ncbi:MAG: L-2-amino-thiazoline-4-carboxylic acid hydrolase [Hungatella sp.]|nr:L-2-amino-thiazoline-4-carboxylic acid hydrolase [Hungatella sp.]